MDKSLAGWRSSRLGSGYQHIFVKFVKIETNGSRSSFGAVPKPGKNIVSRSVFSMFVNGVEWPAYPSPYPLDQIRGNVQAPRALGLWPQRRGVYAVRIPQRWSIVFFLQGTQTALILVEVREVLPDVIQFFSRQFLARSRQHIFRQKLYLGKTARGVDRANALPLCSLFHSNSAMNFLRDARVTRP